MAIARCSGRPKSFATTEARNSTTRCTLTKGKTMKYLYFKTKGVAIPLAALQACADLRFVDIAYVLKKDGNGHEYRYYDSEMKDYSREAIVIDEKEILAEKPLGAE